jgi:hypothetical protein
MPVHWGGLQCTARRRPEPTRLAGDRPGATANRYGRPSNGQERFSINALNRSAATASAVEALQKDPYNARAFEGPPWPAEAAKAP